MQVALKSTLKEAMIFQQTEKPVFDTVAIDTITDRYYTSAQIEIAKFISEYYFSSLSEAISLFVPFRHLEETKRSNVSSISLPTLSQNQQNAYEQLLSLERALLFGVTGSGKTEIFISLMGNVLQDGKSAIFLLPEISLTPQMEQRLTKVFGDTVAMWHSKLTKPQKAKILDRIYRGEVRIIAGARSALFVPLVDVGLIIVDEEHDDSYKAMTRPRYHARDMAIFIGQKYNAKVILASATPSTVSYHKYPVVKLEKPYKETKKSYRFIDGNTITHYILMALRENYNRGEQSLLFLPIRGSFKYLYCPKCGKTHQCPFCSVGMTLHRNHRLLKCHYCQYTEAIREQCVDCGYSPLQCERIGTQEAIELINHEIPNLQIEKFDRDSITTALKLKKALKRFDTGESQLLLGTQMLSKGHDYATITLAIIMGLDYILGLADYRAKEKAVSLFFQIAGRSGRAKSATVITQSANQELFERYQNNYELFLKEELDFLRVGHYPPFVSLARILISHKEEHIAHQITIETVMQLKRFKEVEIVGEGKAPIERIANKYRYHILLRSLHRVPLLKALHSIKCRAIEIDMDPVEFS